MELCGVELSGPVLNGSGTFDAIAARRAFGDVVLERFPFHAALKVVLGWRGLPVQEDVRAPLRTLTPDERADLERWLESS